MPDKPENPNAAIVLLNALMGLPPVVVGLAVFMTLSRSGPLGSWGLLFTPQAMVIAQTVLVAPIIAALTRQTVEDLWVEYRDEFVAMDVGPLRRVATLIWDARFSLVTALLAGFGRAAAEVGATGLLRGAVSEYSMQRAEGGDIPIIAFDAELMDVATGNVVWRSSIARRGKGRIPIVGGGSRSLGRLTQDACDELVAQLRRGAL